MCRMLAKVAIQPFTPEYELLDAPHSLRHQSRCGRQPDAPDTCGPHASGCGIAWLAKTGIELEKRGPEDRWDDSFAERVRALRTTAAIAHNRLASPGLKIDVRTSHPFMEEFRGTPAAFCHNGGVYDLMNEAQVLAITDSQLFFSKLLSLVKSLSHQDIGAALGRLADEWRYTSLTAMMLTPSALHLWRCYDANNARAEDFDRYYTLWLKQSGGSFTIASEAVDNEGWESIPNRMLLSFELASPALNQSWSSF